MKTLILSITLLLAGGPALADSHQTEQVNFNQEIDQNNVAAQDLSKDLSAAMVDQKAEPAAAQEAKADPTQDEKDKVANFVDFEIQSIGQQKSGEVAADGQPNPIASDKQVIDRRYNSVEEPEVTLVKSK